MYITELLQTYNDKTIDSVAYLMAYREYLDNKIEDLRQAFAEVSEDNGSLLCMPITVDGKQAIRYVSLYNLFNRANSDNISVSKTPFDPKQHPNVFQTDVISFGEFEADLSATIENLAVQAAAIEVGLKSYTTKVSSLEFTNSIKLRLSQFSGFITSTAISAANAGVTGLELITSILKSTQESAEVEVANDGSVQLVSPNSYLGSVTLSVITNLIYDFGTGIAAVWNSIKSIPDALKLVWSALCTIISYITGDVEEYFSRYQVLDKDGCGRIDIPIFQFTIGGSSGSDFNTLLDPLLNQYVYDLSSRPEGQVLLYSNSQYNYALDLSKVIWKESSKTDWADIFSNVFTNCLKGLSLAYTSSQNEVNYSPVDIILPGGNIFDFIVRFTNFHSIERMTVSVYPIFKSDNVQNLQNDGLITTAIRNDFRACINQLLSTYPVFSSYSNMSSNVNTVLNTIFNGNSELVSSCNLFYIDLTHPLLSTVSFNDNDNYAFTHILVALLFRALDVYNGFDLSRGNNNSWWVGDYTGHQSGFSARCLLPNVIPASSGRINVEGISSNFIDDFSLITPYDIMFKPYSKENSFFPSIRYLTTEEYAHKITRSVYTVAIGVALIVVAIKATKAIKTFRLNVDAKKVLYRNKLQAYANNPTADNAAEVLKASRAYNRSARILSMFSSSGSINTSVDTESFTNQMNNVLNLIK